MESTYFFRRACVVFCSILLASLILVLRLYDLAAYDSASLEVLNGQYTRRNDLAFRNGFVYDCEGKLLSHSITHYTVLINPLETDKNEILNFLSHNTDLSYDTIVSKISLQAPFTVTLKTNPENTPQGVFMFPVYSETESPLARHILGYRDSENSGVCGIYRKYSFLSESFSGSLHYTYTANASGGILEKSSLSLINDGYDLADGLVLTLDEDIQGISEQIADKYIDMGAITVCRSEDFSLAAVCSRPVYDAGNISYYLSSEKAEFINRAFSLYTPGSVFKAVVAAAALEQDLSLSDFEYECTGKADISGREFCCHEKEGHGVQDMITAFANSCNPYFYMLAEKIGYQSIFAMAEKMGIGEVHLVDGLYVEAGKLPEKENASAGIMLANFAIGQGETMLSTLDLLKIYTICSTGKNSVFSLVKGIYTDEKMTGFDKKQSVEILSPETTEKLCEMMKLCVESGTGKAAFCKDVSVMGKTATVQSGQYKDKNEVIHRIFVGVFPAENPKYTAVILCDGKGKILYSPAYVFSKLAEEICKLENNSKFYS